jgi:hypothetical protein
MIPQLAARGRFSVAKKCFSTSARRRGYEDTIPNLKIGGHTRVIFQGFTGTIKNYFVNFVKNVTNKLSRKTSEF